MSTPSYTPTNANERAMWNAMTTRQKFTHADITALTGVKEHARTNFFAKMKRLGHLRECGRKDLKALYTVLDAQAAQDFAAKKRASKAGAVWAVMRTLGEFTAPEINMSIDADKITITDVWLTNYIGLLLAAGYLKVMNRAAPGRRPTRYRLVNNTGPLPPEIKTKAILVDGNKERVVHVRGELL